MPGRKPITACTSAEWRELCDRARATVPPPHRYAWRFIHSKACADAMDYGQCDMSPEPRKLGEGQRGRAIVKVARGMSFGLTRETMIHEMAHALDSWAVSGAGGGRGHHDSHYWLVYGDVWLAMMEARTG